MAHGGYAKRRPAGRKPGGSSNRSKGPSGGVSKKPKTVSLKNQIRSVERMLRKDLPSDVRETQQKKLEGLKKQQEIHSRLAIERKIFLRDRKLKFIERRKVERRIRRWEKMHRSSSGQGQEADVAEQLSKLKEDLEYVRFFPKTEKYVSLFSGREDAETVEKRNRLRKQIKANLVAAAASGKDLEETGSEDDGLLDLSDDDFFAAGSSSDEGDADDELTDKSAREQASSASGKANSGPSGDERNQRQVSARALMPPPRPSTTGSFATTSKGGLRIEPSSRKRPLAKSNLSSSNNVSSRRTMPSGDRGFSNSQVRQRSNLGSQAGQSRNASSQTGQSRNTSSQTGQSRNTSSQTGQSSNVSSQTGQSSNVSSSSDARKPRRKRRPKKKKQQA